MTEHFNDQFSNARAAVIEAIRSMGKNAADAYAERILYRNLAKSIRKIREARGMTQAELAEKAALPVPRTALENGRTRKVSGN